MRGRGPSLRRRLSLAVAALTLLAVIAAGSLVWLTAALATTVEATRVSVESVHNAERAQIALLLHQRTTDPLTSAQLQRTLEKRLDDARTHVTSPAEGGLVERTRAQVDLYLAGSTEAAPEAYRLLDELVTTNLEQAYALDVHAARVDSLADAVGVGSAFLVLVGAGLLVWWLQTRAFSPVVSLARAMADFGAGKTEARAPEDGAVEMVEMARHFNGMADAIATQRKAQLTFLAGVAHDLRNPLHALLMASKLVRPGDPLPPEAAMRQLFERVRRSVDRLDRMVGDLLDSARVESGQLDLRLDRADLHALVLQVVDLLSDVSPRHRLAVRAPDGPTWAWCDAGRVEQVLGNLISNAIKYSPAGGEVTVEVERADEEVHLRVTDRGIGMTPDEAARLFEPFRRGEKLPGDIPGVGLGLFVVKRLVEAHGGSLAVQSERDVGTTFTVILPAAVPAPATAAARLAESG